MTSTRSTALFDDILGGKITVDDEVLKGSKLPPYRQVIRCMKFHQYLKI